MAEQNFETLGIENATVVHTGIGANDNAGGGPQLLLEWEVPANTKWALVSGEPVTAKLFDNAGNQIAVDSMLIFGMKDVNQQIPTELVQHPYRPHFRLTVAEQNSDRFQGNTRLSVPQGGKSAGPRKRITVSLKTSTANVDLTQNGSELTFRVKQAADSAGNAA